MHCLELTDAQVVQGLRVQLEPEPHINITSDGEYYFPLDPRLAPYLTLASGEGKSPLVFDWLTESDDGEYLTSIAYAGRKKGEESTALVLLNLRALPGGKIYLTASNDRGEVLKGRRVQSSFGPFPPLGISIKGPKIDGIPPWVEGAEVLELAIEMVEGSSFRIHRTKTSKGVPHQSFVHWTGEQLRMTNPEVPRRSFATLGEVAASP